MIADRAALIATFKRLEAESRADFSKTTGVHGSLMGTDATRDCAIRAAEAHGVPWDVARGWIIDSFATLAG